MKRIVNYLVCTAVLFVAVLFLCGGGVWTLCGFAWCFMLYLSGEAFPKFWRMFWMTNARILAHFNCL